MTMHHMNRTSIPWCDFTWNPMTGCTHNCWYCYNKFMPDYDPTPYFRLDRLDMPGFQKKSGTVFVCSTSDIMGKWWQDKNIIQIRDAIIKYPQHLYFLLSKNCPRYRDFSFPDNVMLGTTIEDQFTQIRFNDLMDLKLNSNKTNKLFISFEPLLTRINIAKIDFSMLDWIIIGRVNNLSEEDMIKYTPKRFWIQELVDAAKLHNVRIFMKPELVAVWGDDLIQEKPYLIGNKITYSRYEKQLLLI